MPLTIHPLPLDASTTTGLFTLGGVLVGALGSFALQKRLYLQQRRDAVQDRLYSERSSAYITFLQSAHESAHEVGKLARHDDLGGVVPTQDERQQINYAVDAFAVRQCRVIEILGPTIVFAAAKLVLEGLWSFRDELQVRLNDDDPVTYRREIESEYELLRRPYVSARSEFIRVAKAELERIEGQVH